ncbi:MAG: endonuclease III [Vicinamibacteria bacterium]|nr:endonuclease III [Vicinamibacteria bacterium]
MRETKLSARTGEILDRLESLYPDADCELNYGNAYELLIATILSAQCTDKRVNAVTPNLFARYPAADDLAKAALPEVEEIIQSTGFFRAKAKSITGCARALVAEHGGDVPRDFVAAVKLPGVGRKTASVVLGHAFGIAEGIAVDTHVLRLTARLGLTKNNDPIRVEQELMKLVPQKRWVKTTDLIIFHGRRVCNARKPLCGECGIFDLCAWESKQAYAMGEKKPKVKDGSRPVEGNARSNSLRRSDGVWGLGTPTKGGLRPPARGAEANSLRRSDGVWGLSTPTKRSLRPPAREAKANSLRRSDGAWGLSTPTKRSLRPPAKRTSK